MDTLFFIASKLVWGVIRPESIFLLLLLGALIALRFGAVQMASNLLGSTLAMLAAVAFLPMGDFFLEPLETRFPANPPIEAPEGIVVLGGSERAGLTQRWGQPQINEAGERYLAAIALARAHPEAKLVFAGGSGALRQSPVSEALAAERIFRSAGIAPERMLFEGRSRNTRENAAFARALIGDVSNGPWVLVTSALHIPRSVGVFCADGWGEIIPYPTDFRTGAFWGRAGLRFAENLRDLNRGAKEWVGLLAYRATGRSSAIFPDGC